MDDPSGVIQKSTAPVIGAAGLRLSLRLDCDAIIRDDRSSPENWLLLGGLNLSTAGFQNRQMATSTLLVSHEARFKRTKSS